MALIKSVRGFTPQIGENCYLADNATIIGDVVIGKDCSVWVACSFRTARNRRIVAWRHRR